MNNATKLPIYEARAIFSEQRFKNTLFPKRQDMTGEESEMSLAGLGVKHPVWGAQVRFIKGHCLVNFHHFAQSTSHRCNIKTIMRFLPAEGSNLGANWLRPAPKTPDTEPS